MTDATLGSATSCAFCRFPLEADLTRCPGCSAGHHSECWAENGGCSSIACEGAPATLWASRPTEQAAPATPAAAAASFAAPPHAFPAPAPTAASVPTIPPVGPPSPSGPVPPSGSFPPAGLPVPPPTPGARRRSKGRLPLIAAAALLVVCVIGSVIALAVTGGDSPQDRQRTAFEDDAATALREFDSLDSELHDGLKFVEYQVLVDRVEDAYDDLLAATPEALVDHPAMSAMASALDEYHSAESAWDESLDCTYYCPSVDDDLDGYWQSASSDIADAHDSLGTAE